jgi:hypothetical protein
MISTRSVGLLIDTVVCLTLAKWETVSGRFGGYLNTMWHAFRVSNFVAEKHVVINHGVGRDLLDARAYMLRLPKNRERSARWQRAAQLVLAKADVGAFSRQVELALVYDGKLDVSKVPAE